MDYDVAVIGAGHNGLVAANYLARAGQRVRNPASTHHAVELARIAPWRDRWDLLGLELTPAEKARVG